MLMEPGDLMNDVHTFNAVAEAVKLAVAPVFLLTALGSMLGVLTNRIARIVDRARTLEQRVVDAGGKGCEEYHADLALHGRRARLIQWAISLCTITALLVCALTALMFVNAFFSLELAGTVALLFIMAMLAFIAALLLLLREIHLAIASIRF
jgi:hypothetical protein